MADFNTGTGGLFLLVPIVFAFANNEDWRLRSIEEDLREIKSCITKLPETLERKYISKTEFQPVKTLVYGVAGVILTAFFLYLIRLLLGPLK